MANTSNTSGIPSAPKEIKPTTSEVIQEKLRRRAYELYESRGRENGHDLEDWMQAESELGSAGHARTSGGRCKTGSGVNPPVR